MHRSKSARSHRVSLRNYDFFIVAITRLELLELSLSLYDFALLSHVKMEMKSRQFSSGEVLLRSWEKERALRWRWRDASLVMEVV